MKKSTTIFDQSMETRNIVLLQIAVNVAISTNIAIGKSSCFIDVVMV